MLRINNKNIISFILLIFISVFTIAGCTNEKGSDVQQNTPNKTKKNVSSNQTTLDSSFTPPNFHIDKFQATLDRELVHYKMIYRVSPTLYDLLKETDSKYYMELILPKKVSAVVHKKRTDLVSAPKIKSNNALNYSVAFELKPTNSLSAKERESLVKHKKGYGLYIYNQDKEPIHYFDDIELLSKVP